MNVHDKEKTLISIMKQLDRLDPVKQKVVELFITCLQTSESLSNKNNA